jgi:Uma2 family endonuclease
MNNKVVAIKDTNHSVEDYLSFERNNLNKNEFYNGKIIASKSSSRRHSLIGSNITIALGSRLRRHKCEIYNSNMHVKLSENNFSYPDVIIVKGDPTFCGKEFDVLTNPTVIIEILSEKTMFKDKTEKLEQYLQMDSVQEYLLVDEAKMRVEHYLKQNKKHFMYRIYTEQDEMVSFDSIDCKTVLSELYAKIEY